MSNMYLLAGPSESDFLLSYYLSSSRCIYRSDGNTREREGGEIFHSRYLDVKILSPDDVSVLLVPAEHRVTGTVGRQHLA